MIKKLICLLLVFTLAAAALPALAKTYPAQRGDVNDDAAVLSDSTAKDVETLNERCDDAEFVVVTRHFLGGADVQAYCDELFNAWGLDPYTVLLLLVIGEERYAVTVGSEVSSAISAEQLNSLLSSKLRQPFLQDRDYDGAVGAFLLAAATQIARAEGSSLNTAGLFGTEQTAQSTASTGTSSGSSLFSNWSGNWWSGFYSDDEIGSYNSSGSYDYYEYEDDSGFSVGSLILIVIVLALILRSRRRNGKSGLGILGWGAAAMGAKQISRGMGAATRRTPPRPPRR